MIKMQQHEETPWNVLNFSSKRCGLRLEMMWKHEKRSSYLGLDSSWSVCSRAASKSGAFYPVNFDEKTTDIFKSFEKRWAWALDRSYLHQNNSSTTESRRNLFLRAASATLRLTANRCGCVLDLFPSCAVEIRVSKGQSNCFKNNGSLLFCLKWLL